MQIKVGEWLKEIDSHTIYDHETLTKELLEQTGIETPWPTHSAGSVAARIGSFKGPEYVTSLDHEKVCFGWEIAEALERKLLQTDSGAPFHGRGSRFDAAHQAILKSGL